MDWAVAQFLVWEHGRDNLPYYHQHVWLTDSWETAIVELVDYQREKEIEHHVTMKCFKWWTQERTDIGV